MIPIPDSVELQRDRASEAWLLKKSGEWLSKQERPAGLHATDLLDLRRAFFRAVDPKPLGPREIGLFLPGKVLHAFVLGAAGGKVDLNATDEGAHFSEEFGLWYSPDWDRGGNIAEFKTSRAFKTPKDLSDVDIYVEQVLIYLACKNQLEARLWCLYLNLRDEVTKRMTPTFLCFRVKISQEDLERIKTFIRASKQDYEKAVETGDFRSLDLCRGWLCGARMCEWYHRCRPEGRYGTKEFDAV